MMQHSLTAIPVNTKLPFTNNCTQCTVSADIASVYTRAIQKVTYVVELKKPK